MARQKRRGAPDLPVTQEDKSGSRILKTETGKQTQVLRAKTVSVEFKGGGGGSWQGVVGAGTAVMAEIPREHHRARAYSDC